MVFRFEHYRREAEPWGFQQPGFLSRQGAQTILSCDLASFAGVRVLALAQAFALFRTA